jgi:hypothetical protein
MISPERFFGNFFDDIHIINVRLYNFGQDTLGKLTAANGGGDYTSLIALLTPALAAFGTEVSDVDVALALQKGKTLTVDQVMAAFKLTMSVKEGVIADDLGGRNTPAYMEFYPRGIDEYSRATKAEMPTLTARVRTAATAHSGALGAALTTLLTGFKAQWEGARSQQDTQKGSVEDNRSQRTTARIALEHVLLTTVHTIAAKFPGNVEQCLTFFAFGMLFNQTHHHHALFSSTVLPEQIKPVVNRTFTDTERIRITNPDDNASMLAYLGQNANDAPGAQAKEIQPGRSIHIKPSELGNLSNTFLLVKNISVVNDGAYSVDITEREV